MPPRSSEKELLELGEGTEEEVRWNLVEMSRCNRWLGGRSAIRRLLAPELGEGWRVVDAGCGGGGLMRDLERWCAKRRLSVQLIGLDLDLRNLSVARANLPKGAWLVAGDMTRMPFRDRSIDAAYSTMALHHLDPAPLRQAVSEFSRISGRIAVLNDLVRDRLALWLFRAAAPLIARCRLTRHDGELSIRRAYTPEELRAEARLAGVAEPMVDEDLLFRRMTLALKR